MGMKRVALNAEPRMLNIVKNVIECIITKFMQNGQKKSMRNVSQKVFAFDVGKIEQKKVNADVKSVLQKTQKVEASGHGI
jgi:hypothetical protein